MNAPSRPVFHLEDYQQTPYAIEKTELDFSLYPENTLVKASLTFKRRDGIKPSTKLELAGDDVKLLRVAINGETLSAEHYSASAKKLELTPPDATSFNVTIETEINPKANRQLMGLYLSNGVFCTQCEAEGFRRITYFYDRPDILSVYSVRIEADKKSCPILLSNGNLLEEGDLDSGRHFALWHDPHPKPSYLFALVAGDLDSIHDRFTTMSGRNVQLGVYVEKGKQSRAHYAMDALKRSFAWDEKRFGREYDLDLFNIVAVSDFNMGAMENKGLNIFNDKYVLADPHTATDNDYDGIERVIAHEYFHNWTGDRITCRDWFQLCLKEGLTVYRDQEFSSDERVRPVKRIADIRTLKAAQFPEDSGPLAHPVRPRQYSEINNFYTATIYEKGAEVVRMIHTLLGEALFRKGMDLYFKRHDGEACTIEDFIQCFADISGHDFSQFMLWYEQAGTPQLDVNETYQDGTYQLTIRQSIPPTPGQTNKKPMVIPVRLGFIGPDGKDMQLETGNMINNGVFVLKEQEQTLTIPHCPQKPVVSFLRDFSAPVQVSFARDRQELFFLAAYDSDDVNRWQALNSLLSDHLVAASKGHIDETERAALADSIAKIASDETLDPAFRAMSLSFPGENDIARAIGQDVDPQAIFSARQRFILFVAQNKLDIFNALHRNLPRAKHYSPDTRQSGIRALSNLLLDYISIAKNDASDAVNHFNSADNMTDKIAALNILVHRFSTSLEAKNALHAFEEEFGQDPLVMDKWFSTQAMVAGPHTLDDVKKLMQHHLFSLDNPNRTRALIAVFAAGNPTGFHREDGAAYTFFTDLIVMIDKENPQLSARLATILRNWKQYEPIRREKLKKALGRIADEKSLSTDLADIITRMLA